MATLKTIDELSVEQNKVSIIGVSAGASAAINVFTECRHDIYRLILICGKIKNPDGVNPRYFYKNPAFKESLVLSDKNLVGLTAEDKSKIITVSGLYDSIVPIRETRIKGTKSLTVFSFGHVLNIFVALIFYSGRLSRFLRQPL